MNPYKPVKTRSFEGTTSESGGYGGAAQSGYPALPGQAQGAMPPFLPESQYSPYLPAQAPAKSGSGLFSNFNLSQIKTMIDRMGGIEGVLDTVGKVQKVMQTVQQLAPMFKLLVPKLSSKGNDDEFDEDFDAPRRRRRRRRRRYTGAAVKRRAAGSLYVTRRPAYSRRRPPRKGRK